jgi:NAD(P)H-hydrate epimerase
MNIVKKEILKEIYPQRPQEAHKYDYGLLVVIGGGQFYTGSPALSALAAFKAGVDMVHILAPKRAADIIASFTPDLASYPLPGDIIRKKDLPILLTRIEGAKQVAHGKTAIVVGGGVGRSEETKEVILELIENTDVPMVIDADAIHAVSKKPEVLKGKKIVVTPHLYEFFVLTGKKVIDLKLEDRIKIVQEEAKRLETTILLKGQYDIISQGTDIFINETGSPYLTKGGTGDTLAGILGSLLAQGIDPLLAAQAAAYINGRAGEIAFEKYGVSLLATNLIESIPQVIKEAL